MSGTASLTASAYSAIAETALRFAALSSRSCCALPSSSRAQSKTIRSSSQVDVTADNVVVEEFKAVLSRRSALVGAALAGGVASLNLVGAEPSFAAYGEAANVFGKAKPATYFAPYAGQGFSLNIPAKWNPSRELGEFPNVVLRYEDNFDATNNLVVIVQPSEKSSLLDFGTPEEFLDQFKYLMGVQSFTGETASEGGFAKDTTLTASVLEAESVVKDGRDYYKISVLTRTADGDEGGKHQLFAASISDGKLYILKTQAGDKRWFKGVKKYVEGAIDSFTVIA